MFPPWRGRGYGDALLVAVFGLPAAEGSSTVVVGADVDDWPLGWYRKRGFREIARLPAAESQRDGDRPAWLAAGRLRNGQGCRAGTLLRCSCVEPPLSTSRTTSTGGCAGSPTTGETP